MNSRKLADLSRRSFGAVITVTLILAIIAILGTTTGCGRIREVASVAKTVSDMAKVGEEMSKNESESVDWENYELTEADVRTFYSGVQALQEEYPEIDFEIAMTATLETMSEGINIQKAVERETDMTFDQYSGLSTAILVAQADAEGVRFTTGFVDSMEQTLAEAENLDQETLSEEEKAAIDEQRAALAEARAEIDSPEFKKRQEASEMIIAVREEMGF